MPAGMRTLEDDTDTDPEFGAALQRFYAANPTPGAPVGAPKPLAMLADVAKGTTPDVKVTTSDVSNDVPLYPLAESVHPPSRAAEPEDQALPNVSMPIAGVPLPQPSPGVGMVQGPLQVRTGLAAHVDVPNTAVMQTADRGPLPADHPAVRKALAAAQSNVKVAPATTDSDLDAALRESADRRLVAGLTRAGATAIGRGQGEAYDALDAQADRPLQELQLRRADVAQGRARALAAQEADPKSPQSQQARAFLSKMAPDLMKDPSFAGLTAARAKEIFPWAKELFDASTKKELEDAKIKGELEKFKAKHAGGGAVTGLSKQAAKELAVLQREWDSSGPRSGERGKNQARVNAAGRIEALATGPDGKVRDLSPQQMTEMARQLDTLLSNGGQATEGVTRALSAHTASGRVADMLQWWTSDPHGAGQQEFTRQMLETARREKEIAGGQLRDSYISTLPGVPTLLKERPDVIQNMLRANGVDPEGLDLSTGLRRPGASSLAPTAHPQADAALAWAKAHPDDPRAAKILQRLGVQ